MKHAAKSVFFICLLSVGLSASAFAAPKAQITLPPHFSGLGVFTFKSSVNPASDPIKAKVYAEEMKQKGLSFVILKSHDGSSWGTRVGAKREWKPAISKDLIDAFHKEGIRVYSYFTGRMDNKTSVREAIRLAVLTLDMGADGVVVDDLGLFGASKKNWTDLFVSLRTETDKRPGKILAFSAFPHLNQWSTAPWAVAIQYSDYFLPQEYWNLFKAGNSTKMLPQNALAYGQGQFDSILARYPNPNCKLVPIGMTYGSKINTEQIKKFLDAAQPFYVGVGLFTYEHMPKGGWDMIKEQSKAYAHNRVYQKLSIMDRINNPPKSEKKGGQVTKIDPSPKKKDPSKAANKKPAISHPISSGGGITEWPGTP